MGSLKRFEAGTKASHRGRACELSRPFDLTNMLVVYLDDGETAIVPLNDLDQPSDGTSRGSRNKPHHDSMTENERAEAARRSEILQRLQGGRWNGDQARAVAKEAGVNVRTLYRWREALDGDQRLAALKPNRGGKRKRRLNPKAEAIVKECIQKHYLHSQRKIAQKVIEAVQSGCRSARVKPPHANTIRKRIAEISDKEKTKRRKGAKAARDRHEEIRGQFPGATYPLAVVQIDHTKLDIHLVDEKHREPIGRPWLTLAIDVHSRMIMGFYLSLDAPSANSVGLCIQHSANKKDSELARLNIDAEWPVWGFMRTLHADNGKDFRSATIRDACLEYGIDINWRPVKTPHYGGHIERMLGTVAKEIHAIPGTTFSNVQERGDYKSEAKARMTLDELRTWFVTWITGVYHNRVHRQIGTTPLAKWKTGILGDGKKVKGIGLPPAPSDPERLRLDFLPFKDRTVQRDGISWDNVAYFDPQLRRWIRETKGGRPMTFRVRRDPFDISKVYFLDPELKQYIEIPYRDVHKPSITKWELKRATDKVRQDGHNAVNEELIFQAWREMDQMIEISGKTTAKARRDEQKRREAEKHIASTALASSKSGVPSEPVSSRLQVVVDNVAQAAHADTDTYDLDDDDFDEGFDEWQ